MVAAAVIFEIGSDKARVLCIAMLFFHKSQVVTLASATYAAVAIRLMRI